MYHTHISHGYILDYEKEINDLKKRVENLEIVDEFNYRQHERTALDLLRRTQQMRPEEMTEEYKKRLTELEEQERKGKLDLDIKAISLSLHHSIQ